MKDEGFCDTAESSILLDKVSWFSRSNLTERLSEFHSPQFLIRDQSICRLLLISKIITS